MVSYVHHASDDRLRQQQHRFSEREQHMTGTTNTTKNDVKIADQIIDAIEAALHETLTKPEAEAVWGNDFLGWTGNAPLNYLLEIVTLAHGSEDWSDDATYAFDGIDLEGFADDFAEAHEGDDEAIESGRKAVESLSQEIDNGTFGSNLATLLEEIAEGYDELNGN
jgi:hypothetical protein